MFDRYVLASAQIFPHRTAVVSVRGDLSYVGFNAVIDRMAATLTSFGPPDDKVTAVRIADPYTHLLVLLGLARLGRASASYGPAQGPHLLGLLAPGAVISDHAPDLQQVEPPQRLLATPAWLASVLSQPVAPMPRLPLDPDALARVTTSSGTTGVAKKIGWSWREIDDQLRYGAILLGTTGRLPRMMPLIGLETGALNTFLSAWAMAGAGVLVSTAPSDIVAALTTLHPTSLDLAPIQLRLLLDVLPADFAPMADLRVTLYGSDTPAAVKHAARLRLSPDLWITYASSEAGMIAAGHAATLDDRGSAGWLLPLSELEVVDEQDAGLPVGVSGRLRVRGATCAKGYLDDEAASARAFKDGWFYPGDLGTLGADGRLRIDGRTDEVMNFGGEKFLPHTLEDPVRACPGVIDAAAFSLADASGLPAPWIAVIRGEGLDQAALSRALAIPSLPPVHVVWTAEIPRNALGKVQRDRLRDAARSLVDKPQADAAH